MSDTPEPPPQDGANGEDDAEGGDPYIHAHAQYIKDLSFENPMALEAVTGDESGPQVTVNCAVEARKLSEQTYEVVLSMEGRAKRGDKTLFLVSIDYAGLFSLANLPEEHLEPVLNIHCPSLLFPFARSVIANVTRDGGYPPLLIDIIDFNALYYRQKQGAGSAAEEETGPEPKAEDEAAEGPGGED